MDASQGGIVVKRPITKAGNGIRQIQLCKTGAVGKGITANAPQTDGHGYGFHIHTVVEAVIADLNSRVGQIHRHKTAAVIKRTASDGLEGIVEAHIGEIGASVEGGTADTLQLAGQDHRFQRVIFAECAGADGLDNVAVDHFRQDNHGVASLISGNAGIGCVENLIGKVFRGRDLGIGIYPNVTLYGVQCHGAVRGGEADDLFAEYGKGAVKPDHIIIAGNDRLTSPVTVVIGITKGYHFAQVHVIQADRHPLQTVSFGIHDLSRNRAIELRIKQIQLPTGLGNQDFLFLVGLQIGIIVGEVRFFLFRNLVGNIAVIDFHRGFLVSGAEDGQRIHRYHAQEHTHQ